MCIGGMRASKPQVYKRPNPNDIYYNGNIYDPKPQEEIDAQNQAKAEQMASAMLGEGDKGKRSDKLNQSSTGLNIT
tara:strand:- start:4192 stop:4419 length:228 start_codon:yes stop_codon:yes gene_type:complete